MITSTKSVKFVLGCNIAIGAIALLVWTVIVIVNPNARPSEPGQAYAVGYYSAYYVFCMGFASPLILWLWLNWHGFSQLNKLRLEAVGYQLSVTLGKRADTINKEPNAFLGGVKP